MEVDLKGPVYYLDFDESGEAGTGPRTVYVHGLGGSHINWIGLAPLMAGYVRGMAVDLPGFGLTPAAGRRTTVAANAQVLKRFLREVVGEQVVLVGNSMGGLISMIVAAEAPELVSRLVLIDPVLPLARGVRLDPAVGKQFLFNGVPWLGEWVLARRYARVPARQRVAEVLARCCLDAERVSSDMLEKLIELEESLSAQADHAACQLAAARSIVRGLAWSPAYWRRMTAIGQPVLLLHGTHDRLVPIVSARQAARRLPHWTFVELDTGHIPQMEAPQLVADEMVKWLNKSA
jgi:pimeloyl-ACP methyl ester carboxylesterase